MLFSKIGHQIDYFGKIKINLKFRPCRQILEIYRDWLLSACPAYSGPADFRLEKTLPLYFVDKKQLVGI